MIRLYGMTIGNGSYARVTRGVRDAFERLGLLEGVIPLDALDDWGEYPGAMAKVAITIGPQMQPIMARAYQMGAHERRLALLPMNSSYCSEPVLQMADPPPDRDTNLIPEPVVTEWLTPSRWSAEKIYALTKAPVSLWPHGISDAFVPNENQHAERVSERAHGAFNVLHLSSSAGQRKGTLQVIEAWGNLVRARKLGPNPKLTLVLSYWEEDDVQDAVSDYLSSVEDTVTVKLSSMNLDDAQMADTYRRFHAVCQPSRGEGFGLCPLEARACGVPVVATACSGHADHVTTGDPGVVIVSHGPDTLIDDGPGALAPSVSARAVADALGLCYVHWQSIAADAQQNARQVQAKWNWLPLMRTWAQQEGWLSESGA